MEDCSQQSTGWSREVLRNTAIFQKLSSLLFSMNGESAELPSPYNSKDEQEWFFSCLLRDGRASNSLLSLMGTHYCSLWKRKPPRDSFSREQAISKAEWCWAHQAADLSYISFWEEEKWNLFCSRAVSVLLSCSGLAAGKPEAQQERKKPLEKRLWSWR